MNGVYALALTYLLTLPCYNNDSVYSTGKPCPFFRQLRYWHFNPNSYLNINPNPNPILNPTNSNLNTKMTNSQLYSTKCTTRPQNDHSFNTSMTYRVLAGARVLCASVF